ncbi:MAG: hypothetical protein EOP32_16645 [Rhodococcus sp. (in: high G+C Gram-positive bacteria)]|nr:MAG: hypothetical protein EOP32_16645 [Rhodococcus sp. (in: high G+C Gram-positive bacteria)]
MVRPRSSRPRSKPAAVRNRPPHTPIRGTPQIRTVSRSPVWAGCGDLLLVATATVDRPSDTVGGYFTSALRRSATRSRSDSLLPCGRWCS